MADTGRPTKYREEFNDLAFKCALLGATDRELADIIGICEATLNTWKIEYPIFLESIKRGKERADMEVVQSLYKRAVDGDTTSQIYWLNNRRRQNWSNRKEVEITGNAEDLKALIESKPS